jgi:RimJ/RimL family protein N-acetyltransferase
MTRFSSVSLRALWPGDYDALYIMSKVPGVGDRWRFHDHAPSFDEFVETLWTGVLEQSVIHADDSIVGLVSAYAPDLRNGACQIGLVTAPDFLQQPHALYGAGQFISRLFRDWPLRLLHFQVYGYNYAALGPALSRFAQLSGRLRDDLRWRGELHDQYIFTVTREAWEAGADRHPPRLPRATATPGHM